MVPNKTLPVEDAANLGPQALVDYLWQEWHGNGSRMDLHAYLVRVFTVRDAEVRRLQAEREDDAEPEGHEEPCYYCQEPCNSLAGNPSLWPVALCHADEPGVVKWHHTGCVSERLVERAAAPPVGQTDLVTLAECPIGLFVTADGDTLALKTEYGDNEGRIDAYIVSSGEFFWGDSPQTITNQRKQLVRPVYPEKILKPIIPPPVGQTVEEFAAALKRHFTNSNAPPSSAVIDFITARDAEVAAAAAETLYEQLGEAIHAALRKASDHEEAGKAYAAIKAMPDKDWWAVLEFAIAGMGFSRAPAPAEKGPR